MIYERKKHRFSYLDLPGLASYAAIFALFVGQAWRFSVEMLSDSICHPESSH
jgi:hypothetical protein